MIKNCA
jgi:hypothetical protein